MAKGQVRSNREAKKPKQPPKPATPASPFAATTSRGGTQTSDKKK